MSETEITTPRQMIMQSHYREFPEMITTLELCRAMAKKDRRSITESLRNCASALSKYAVNKSLRSTLEDMARSRFPEVHINRIRACLVKMERALSKELR